MRAYKMIVRHLVSAALLAATACGDGATEHICLDTGAALYCADSTSCCDTCRLAAPGGACSGTTTCAFGDNNMQATCTNGAWQFTTLTDLSVHTSMDASASVDANAADALESTD